MSRLAGAGQKLAEFGIVIALAAAGIAKRTAKRLPPNAHQVHVI
jgi:hypothetical protein